MLQIALPAIKQEFEYAYQGKGVRMTANTEEVLFKKTISLEEIRKRIIIADGPLNVFDEWPVREIREECLAMLEQMSIANEYAGWFENRISSCLENDDHLWQRLLSCYIFRSCNVIHSQARALEFAIGLAKEKRFAHWGVGEISKLVAGKIKQNPELYWRVPSMHEFLNLLISWFLKQSSGEMTDPSTYYTDTQWHEMERALRIALAARDTTLLPVFETVFEKLNLGLKKPTECFKDDLMISSHIAFLSGAISVLKRAEKDQNPDLNATAVGVFLRKKADISGNVGVYVGYAKRVFDRNSIPVTIRLFPTNPAERDRLCAAHSYCRVRIRGEGCCTVSIPHATQQSSEVSNDFDENLSCHFLVFPSRGMNRFWLRFDAVENHGLRFLLEMACYISCE